MSDLIKILDLGAFSDDEKNLLRTDFSYKKQMSKLMKSARAEAKRETCYYCGKEVTSFCNSHSVPEFCLRNISDNGEVLTLNTVVDNPLMESEAGVGKAGTFHLICNDCDSKIFSDYETPENYSSIPTARMVSQMALKNCLKSISKRLFEIELFNITAQKTEVAQTFSEAKNYANNLDLKEYESSYNKAKKALEKKDTNAYYVCYYKKLNYVVPIAFQCSIALVFDFEGNVINYIYNPSPDYKIRNIHINIFPLKTETAIIMFVENGDKRYRQFYKQFLKLTEDEQLAALTFIMFAYSEDMFFSKTIKDEILQSKSICEIGKSGQDILSFTPNFDPMETIRDLYDLNKRNSIPNLLSEKYKIR